MIPKYPHLVKLGVRLEFRDFSIFFTKSANFSFQEITQPLVLYFSMDRCLLASGTRYSFITSFNLNKICAS